LDFAVSRSLPIVLCTTGLTETTEEKIISLQKKIPIFKSGNMSLGINLILELAKIGARVLEGFDVEIIEKHHRKKIDAPSGTALMIADAVKSVQDSLEYKHGRQGIAKRVENELGIHAIRGGTITGEHTLLFAGTDEVIELKHQATSKAVFAKGAIDAAFFLLNKKAGLYDMTNLIKGE
jgi:4-hydroxy-tetrahydrodipicolinate reductase